MEVFRENLFQRITEKNPRLKVRTKEVEVGREEVMTVSYWNLLRSSTVRASKCTDWKMAHQDRR
jgi:hypothetical protein